MVESVHQKDFNILVGYLLTKLLKRLVIRYTILIVTNKIGRRLKIQNASSEIFRPNELSAVLIFRCWEAESPAKFKYKQ